MILSDIRLRGRSGGGGELLLSALHQTPSPCNCKLFLSTHPWILSQSIIIFFQIQYSTNKTCMKSNEHLVKLKWIFYLIHFSIITPSHPTTHTTAVPLFYLPSREAATNPKGVIIFNKYQFPSNLPQFWAVHRLPPSSHFSSCISAR